MEKNQDLTKLIKLTGERAKLDAKANGTYVVYKDISGKLVREYSNGEKEFLPVDYPPYV
ncbi:hypothetical protein YDYSY3_47520 [Paenibacillus chitinolyticus]|uniref:hypothetical protein n=1 Tax=Paenibacillus chitinolyticus TaxID=79263 RepID=UPI0026E4F41D|nr:hypothetical protein [Paenibacillus chitinolyticus]GKS13752.1 hypothetical protein YDYSY3_47520 [Paenibacillus chitinolyticus]